MSARRWTAAGAAVVTAVLIAACGTDHNAGTDHDDAGNSDDIDGAPARVVDEATVSDSGVGIRAAGCGLTDAVGSGVVVERTGLVATVAHTLAGSTEVTVVDADGVEHEAVVVAFDADADLAALSVPTLTAPPLPIGDVRTGAATSLRWRSDEGVTSMNVEITRRLGITIEDIYVEEQVRRTGMELAADISIGDSGGPVIVDGTVVGIVYANSKSRPRIGFATDDAELRELLQGVSTIADAVDTGRCL